MGENIYGKAASPCRPYGSKWSEKVAVHGLEDTVVKILFLSILFKVMNPTLNEKYVNLLQFFCKKYFQYTKMENFH